MVLTKDVSLNILILVILTDDKKAGTTTLPQLEQASSATSASTNSSPPASLIHNDMDLTKERLPPPPQPAPRPAKSPRNTIQPGAFHDDGRNARDVETGLGDDTDIDPIHEQRDLEVTAELVDPAREQERIAREVQDQLQRERQYVKIAEVVDEEPRQSICSRRVLILSSIAVLLGLVAVVVMGIVLPRTDPPQTKTTAAPTTAPPTKCSSQLAAHTQCFQQQGTSRNVCFDCVQDKIDNTVGQASSCGDFSGILCPAIESECPGCAGCEFATEHLLACNFVTPDNGCPFLCGFDAIG